jgi:hypothetical protein
MPGEIRVDFMVQVGGIWYPIQIDGDFAHKTSGQKNDDRAKDAILNNRLQGTGAMPVQRIPGHLLETYEMATQIGKELF